MNYLIKNLKSPTLFVAICMLTGLAAGELSYRLRDCSCHRGTVCSACCTKCDCCECVTCECTVCRCCGTGADCPCGAECRREH